jgi:hypothetical protein
MSHHHHHPDHAASISDFTSSSHGRDAMDALAQNGIVGQDAENVIQHAAAAAHAHVEEHAQSTGILGAHPGKSFFAAFAAGLLKGDGVFGSIADGAEGVISGRIAEAIATKAGLDSSMASTAAAAVTPFLVSFLKSKLGHG